jgi:hypothetical protein
MGLGGVDERAIDLNGDSAFIKEDNKRAILNAPFIVGSIPDADVAPYPGNVYLARSWRSGDVYPLTYASISVEAIVNDSFSDPSRARGRCELLMVELTPACDFVQGKATMVRLVGGILVPQELARQVKTRTAFLWVSPLIEVPGTGRQHLVLNAHFMAGRPATTIPIRADFRIRRQAMIDIQAWFASHAGRPGYMSV